VKTVATLALLISATLMWQQSPNTAPVGQTAKPQRTKPAQKTLSPEQKMWCPVLDYAVNGAKSFEPPMRAYLLDTTSPGLGKCDVTKARAALVDSFTATLQIPEKEEDMSASDDQFPDAQARVEAFRRLETKRNLQRSALTHLLSVDETKTQSLLDLTEPSVRTTILSAIISRAVSAKNYNRALEFLKRAAPDGFPYGEGCKDASRSIVAGGNRARARNLQNNAEAREELPQWGFSARGTAGLFRRS